MPSSRGLHAQDGGSESKGWRPAPNACRSRRATLAVFTTARNPDSESESESVGEGGLGQAWETGQDRKANTPPFSRRQRRRKRETARIRRQGQRRCATVGLAGEGVNAASTGTSVDFGGGGSSHEVGGSTWESLPGFRNEEPALRPLEGEGRGDNVRLPPKRHLEMEGVGLENVRVAKRPR